MFSVVCKSRDRKSRLPTPFMNGAINGFIADLISEMGPPSFRHW